MTYGLFYRFRIRSRNELDWSEFSNVVKVGLGPKPSKPTTPQKSTNEETNSPSSINVVWSELLSQTLTVT
jgi:hypothetical protein